jgi:hypothetical protein
MLFPAVPARDLVDNPWVRFLQSERQDFSGHSCPACTAYLPATI